jgi:hypothetical protein
MDHEFIALVASGASDGRGRKQLAIQDGFKQEHVSLVTLANGGIEQNLERRAASLGDGTGALDFEHASPFDVAHRLIMANVERIDGAVDEALDGEVDCSAGHNGGIVILDEADCDFVLNVWEEMTSKCSLGIETIESLQLAHGFTFECIWKLGWYFKN